MGYQNGLILEHKKLKELISYDPETGLFHWKKRRSGVRTGIAGCKIKQGYILIRVSGRLYQAHRLAWFYFYGKWPLLPLDHKNRVRDDNRISNLREATPMENSRNQWPWPTPPQV